MALRELEEYEDDYVILSDTEQDNRNSLDTPRVSLHNPSQKSVSFSSKRQQQQQPQEEQGQSNAGNASRSGDDSQDDSDLDDIEEIEYGYDNDTLLIMPAMLRDYSHHATNYHPELWKAPAQTNRSSQAARYRHEDRLLDRQELLKNTIPPTTCGICFDSFVPFDLDPLKNHEPNSGDIPAKAQFAFSFTSRLARSFASKTTNNIHDTDTPQTANAETSTSSGSATSIPNSQKQNRRSLVSRESTAPSITPSVSSKDIGITLPCDHGLCLSCLQSLLTNATQNSQARFPTTCPQPGCRTPIPTESAELVLEQETLEIWYRKLAEIHVANKVCCPQPECQSIIDLDDKDGTAVTCPDCKSSFCASCAVPFHRGMTCEQYQEQAQGGNSEEDRAMLQLVQDRHWRHCPSCRFVIEKQQGCNHMVCHCGQSFCYACGNSWDELNARCSRECERYGIDDDDTILDCIIM